MVRRFFGTAFGAVLLLGLSGCTPIGSKSMNISIVYALTCICSFVLLLSYLKLLREKDVWFVLLFTAVFVVNTGYLCLAISQNLSQALWSNRLAYLGSVFLPLSMLMIILNVCKINYPKNLHRICIGLSFAMFLLTAGVGVSDIYYKEVTFEIVNGMGVLRKVYGSWHSAYLFYLVGYFFTMIIMIMYASKTEKIQSSKHAILLLMAVFVNICVWLLEQLVAFNFEFLSVSYIITELFLMCLYMLLQENDSIREELISKLNYAYKAKNTVAETDPEYKELISKSEFFASQISTLTPAETKIYNLYLGNKTTQEILKILNIKENTLKFHNKNIYGKLGVSSRKELVKIAEILNSQKDTKGDN